MFEWLFKVNHVAFAEGEIGFQAGPWLFGAVVVGLLVVLVVVYVRSQRYPTRRVKAVSAGLRGAALLVLCLPLLEPVLITPDVVPDENFVAVLADASESMNIPDGVLGATRADDARQLLFNDESGLVPALEPHFKLRYYTFDDAATRVDSLRATRPDGRATNLSAALDRVRSDFKGIPLKGLVLLTDGGDNSTGVPLNQAEELRNLDIPLHIVGLGRERFETERELLDVTVSKSVEENTGAEIDVKVRSWAAEATPVTFSLYRGEERVFSEARMLKGDGKTDQFTFFYEPDTPGARAYTLHVDEAPGELNTENNTLDLLVDPRADTLRVLYFEGHLRRDFKFIKRALEDDQVITFSSVSRTGTGKYYRQGLTSAEEMRGGFPNTRADLYRFHAVLLGDLEASAFAPEQLQMLEQFVRVRGGGLLMLGGREAFTEGDYWNTPLADVLPVALDLSRRSVVPPVFFDPRRPVFIPGHPEENQGFPFVPTAEGLESLILKLSPDPAVNRRRWTTMPPLTSLNLLGPVKPGAQVLAEKPEDDFGGREPLLVVQRYGKGRSAALATASTWRWQMLLDADDTRHERFWRQLARWLAASAPERVDLDLGAGRFAPRDEVTVTATVFDPVYEPVEGARVEGAVTDPQGQTQPATFLPALGEPGTYVATVIPEDTGVYEIRVSARQGDVVSGTHAERFLVRPSKKEFYDATLKRAFLENLATTSGGRYYDIADVDELPARLRNRRTSTSIFHAEPLWDMPLLYLLALVLLSAEWFYRRRKGLP